MLSDLPDSMRGMAPTGHMLKCLGYPELLDRDGRVVRVRVKKHFALLIYLALEGNRAHDRDRIVELLWPRVPVRQGRHSCANAISALRGIFGHSSFISARNTIRFVPGSLAIDIHRLQAGEVVDANGAVAVEIDGFLRGFEIEDSPPFALWKDREHSRWLPTIHSALLTLIDHGRRRGSPDEIMRRADRLLSLDHMAEEGIRAKMEAFALAGDRISAIRLFDEWKRRLRGEFRAEPSATVEAMAAQLRKRGWEPKETHPPVATEQWTDRCFIGRQAEYRQLYETWEGVHHYRPQHVVILGESGVGKSTLTQRLVTAAGLEGASVSHVQCYQMEQRIPFATIGGLVAGLIGRPGVTGTSPEALSELAKIVPQIRAAFPGVPSANQTGETTRLALADALSDLVQAVVGEGPLLLVIDDAHYADEASRALLHLLARRIIDGRFMIVGVAGSTIGGPAHPDNEVDWLPSNLVTRLELGPLTFEESVELLQVSVPAHVGPPRSSEKRVLAAASRGFPRAVELVAQDWTTNLDRCAVLAMRGLTRTSGAIGPVVGDPYRQLAERLTRTLSPLDRQVLALAAVIGPALNDLGAYSIVGLDVNQAAASLGVLASLRVLRDLEGGLAFADEHLRAHVYHAVPITVRVRLHQAYLEWATRNDASDAPPVHRLDLAWHLLRANTGADASSAIVAGARSAFMHGAADDLVLALQSGMGEIRREQRDEATALLVQGLQEVGRWSDSLLLAANHAEREPLFRVLQLEALWNLGSLNDTAQRRCVEELLSISDQHELVSPRSLTLAAWIGGSSRDESMMAPIEERLMLQPTRPGADGASLLTARAYLAFYRRQIDVGESAATEALKILRGLSVTNTAVTRLEIGLSVFRIARGDYLAALRHLQSARGHASKLDNIPLSAVIHANLSLCCLRLGRLDEAICYARLVPETEKFATIEPSVYAECCSLALLGRVDDCLARMARSNSIENACTQPWMWQAWQLHSADIFLTCGRRAKAMELGRIATTGSYGIPLSRGATGHFIRWTMNRHCDRDDTGAAEALVANAMADRSKLDALDRLEVVCVAAEMRRRTAHTPCYEEEINDLRRSLPEATLAFLDRVTEWT